MRGCVVQIEKRQGPKLLQSLRDQGHGGVWLPGAAPEVALRLPAPYVALCIARAWRAFILPRLPVRNARAGSSTLVIPWTRLKLAPPISATPAWVGECSWSLAPPTLALTSHEAGNSAQHLRAYASTLDLTDEFNQGTYKSVVHTVLALQRVSDELDEGAASRLTQEFRHHAFCPSGKHTNTPTKGRPLHYNVSFLLHSCLVAHLLRDQRHFKSVLESSLRLTIAPSL